MKKIGILLTFIALITFAGAQNAPVASAKKATPTMKVDSKVSTIKTTPASSEPAKACCQGKAQGQCTHDAKTCSKEAEAKPACCQKGGTTGACNHAEAGKATDATKQ